LISQLPPKISTDGNLGLCGMKRVAAVSQPNRQGAFFLEKEKFNSTAKISLDFDAEEVSKTHTTFIPLILFELREYHVTLGLQRRSQAVLGLEALV
jgi:hypothetical protein